ncbi:MAG: hypothetical protein JWM11_7946 [Planctomycetaceae bacterium]|nr:hypothetical protein [Planctomycetaceae bacterium]
MNRQVRNDSISFPCSAWEHPFFKLCFCSVLLGTVEIQILSKRSFQPVRSHAEHGNEK